MQSNDGQFDKYLAQVGKEISSRVNTTEGNKAKAAGALLSVVKARRATGETKSPEGMAKLQADVAENDTEVRTANAVTGNMSIAEYGKLKNAGGVSGDSLKRAANHQEVKLIKE